MYFVYWNVTMLFWLSDPSLASLVLVPAALLGEEPHGADVSSQNGFLSEKLTSLAADFADFMTAITQR